MSTSLHDALRDLADEITPDDIPDGLAERAWASAQDTSRTPARRLALPLLAAAAVVGLVFWLLSAGVGRQDGAPAQPTQSLGLPERVRYDGDPPALPAKGRPVAAVLSTPVEDIGDLPPGHSGVDWRAVTSDGRLWALSDEVLPDPRGLADDEMMLVGDVAPAVSPDGARLAVVRSRVRVEADELTNIRGVQLDIHDLRTGQHTTVHRVLRASDLPNRLEWSPDGSTVAALADVGGGKSRLVMVTADGSVLHRDDGWPGLAVSRPEFRPVLLAGWMDSTRVLLLRLHSPRKGPSTLTPITTETTSTRIGTHRPVRTWGAVRDYRGGGTPHEASFTTLGDRLVERTDRHSSSQPTWTVRPPLGTSGRGETLRWSPSRELLRSTAEEGSSDVGDARLIDDGRGRVVLSSTLGSTGVVVRLGEQEGGRLLTVIDPGLQARDVVIAAEATHRRSSESVFGTSTGWWAWHPLGAAAIVLGMVGAVVALGVWLARPDHVIHDNRP